MNIINKIFKKKQKQNEPLPSVNLNFVNKIDKYHCDTSYHKTINILRKDMFIVVYYKHLDIPLGNIYINVSTTISKLHYFIYTFLQNTNVLLTNINDFNLFACKKINNTYTNIIKIDKDSNKNILELGLQYNEYKSYNTLDSEHRLPFFLNIFVEPLHIPSKLYLNYKNNIELCQLKECFICYETKYLKNICPNKHYICFNCIKSLIEYKKNKCPYCNTLVSLSI